MSSSEDPTGGGLGGVSGGGLEGGATGTGGTGGTSSAGAGGGATASGTLAAGLGGLAGRLPNGGASLLNRLAEGSPLPVHDHLTPSTGGPIDYLRTQWGTDHLAAADPHAQYATDADLTAYATDADLTAHAAAADPHPVYLTAAELPPATEVTVTTDASLTSTESPANTFALAVRLSPDAGNALALRGNGLYGTDTTGGGAADVTLTGTEGVTVSESPANTFALGLTASPDANNTVEVRANGIYAAAGAIPPEYVTDAELATALGPYATDADLAAHAAAADPHPVYLTAAEGDALFLTQTEGDGRYPLRTDPDPYPAYLTPTEGDARYVPLTLADAKGDLLAASGPDALGRLALGTTDQVLTADGAQPLGVKWAAPATQDHGHGGGAGTGGTLTGYLPAAGGTMTGTIAAQGAAVDAGGALAVTSPNVAVTDLRTYGSALPAFVEGSLTAEHGLRFTPTGATFLVAVRWYRANAATNRTPVSVRLWDTTSTATPVWTLTTPAAWSDTALGWKEHRLAAGTQPALVAGRQYVLSFTKGASSLGAALTSYAPTPDAGITVAQHVSNATGGVYPTTTGTTAWGIDAVLRPTVTSPNPAQSGALRLPNGATGAVTWRSGNDGADLPLSANASDQLVFNGAALLNQTTADALFLTPAEGDAAYLNVTGDTATGALVLQGASATANVLQTRLAADTQPRFRADASGLHEWGPGGSTAPDATLQRTGAGALRLDTHLGVGVAPAAWSPSFPAVQVGGGAALWGTTGGAGVWLTSNSFFDGTSRRALVASQAAVEASFGSSGVSFLTAPAVAAGAAQTFTTRATIAQTGTLTLTPDAGQAALQWAGGQGSLRNATTTPGDPVLYSQGFLFVNPLGNYVLPDRANAINLGSGALPYQAMYAQTGTIQPSAAAVKEAITPLDPAAALAAVLATDPVTFTYTAPAPTAEQYELPDDPEQAEAVLHQRLVNVPLMEAARSQAGFVLASPDYATDPLFETGAGQSNAANSAGVLLAALHEIDRRLTAGGL